MLDGVIEPGNAADGAKWLDLLTLVIAGGRERTEEIRRSLSRHDCGRQGPRAQREGGDSRRSD